MKAVVALIAVGLVGVASSATLPKKPISLPKYIQPCQRDLPDLDSCILTSLQHFLPHLSEENKDLGLPSFDPHVANDIFWDFTNGLTKVTILLNDVSTYGLSKMRFVNVRTDFTDEKIMNFQVDAHVPNLRIEGKFKYHGELLGAQLSSSGTFDISMTNVTAEFTTFGTLVTIDDEKYMKITNIQMDPEIGTLKFNATNLVKNNPELSTFLIQEINRNWKSLYSELLNSEILEKQRKMLMDFANSVLLRVPFDKIFPPSN